MYTRYSIKLYGRRLAVNSELELTPHNYQFADSASSHARQDCFGDYRTVYGIFPARRLSAFIYFVYLFRSYFFRFSLIIRFDASRLVVGF